LVIYGIYPAAFFTLAVVGLFLGFYMNKKLDNK
jgi:hypothetical protein